MSEILTISHIDVAVHFDYGRLKKPDISQTDESIERFERVKQRVVTRLVPDPRAVMFYFSTFLSLEDGQLVKDPDVKNHSAFESEQERISFYRQALRSRFFLFGGWEHPNFGQLEVNFEEQGFTYNQESTTLLAYGEWFEFCVQSWKRQTQQDLGLKVENTFDDPNLSLSMVSSKPHLITI